MVYFVYLRRGETGQNPSIIIVRAGSDGVIFVPYGYLPLNVDKETHTDPFGDVHIFETDDEDDRGEIYVLIHIDELFQKLMDSDTIPNIKLALNILERSKYDGWEEGWAWNIDTSNFELRPKPDGHCHSWVHHTQSWEPTCPECFKPDCPSVEILSKEIPLSILEKLYCDCSKCDECDSIYDLVCKCQAIRSQPNVYSSDSSLLKCQHCHAMYDSRNQRTADFHFFIRCC